MNKIIFKTVVIALTMLLLNVKEGEAQFLKELGDRLKNRAKENVIQKAESKVDNGINEAAKAPAKGKKETGQNTAAVQLPKEQKGTYSSKFDFIPGDKVLWYEDFSSDAIGDFPLQWNTNSTGEIVTVNGSSVKWLKIGKNGLFMPSAVTKLPDNFTLQFDLLANKGFSYYAPELNIEFASLSNKKEYTQLQKFKPHNKSLFNLWLHPENAAATAGHSGFSIVEKGIEQTKNEVNTTRFFTTHGTSKVKVAIWRQQQRLRVYLDDEKIWDLPQAFDPGVSFNTLLFMLHSLHEKGDHYFISNIRLAAGLPDTRNQLVKEGKFVTRGILFDDGSDQVKPESYTVLKDIATVLKENGGMRVKIVGHTDNTGDEKSNDVLSETRALAVKKALCKNFNIGEDRMETAGKGEKEPTDNNNNATGRANNRRVEFTKL